MMRRRSGNRTGVRTAGTALLTLAATALVALPAAAQDWREMSSSRQRNGEERIDVRVRYGAGELRVRPGSSGSLYRMDLTYDEEQFSPVSSFDGSRLDLGVDQRGRSINMRGRNRSEMDLQLGRDVEMDLVLEFGAVEADLDLGGLALRTLELSTGASESRLDVSAPNPVRMRTATLDVGAADFQARRLGNLNVERFELNAGVGSVLLDFTGELRNDVEVVVKMGLGSLELLVPEDAGVRIEKESFLASLDTDGMVKRGDAYYSSNWDDADHRIRIEVQTAFGSVQVRRVR